MVYEISFVTDPSGVMELTASASLKELFMLLLPLNSDC